MTILLIADALPGLGVKHAVISIANALRAEGLPILVIEIPQHNSLNKIPFYISYFNIAKTIKQISKQNDISIIHCNGTNFVSSLMSKTVMHANLSNSHIVTTVHGTMYSEFRNSFRYPLSKKEWLRYLTSVSILELHDTTLYHLCENIVAVSEQTKKELLLMGICRSKISVIPNCIDVNLFSPPSFDYYCQLRKSLGIPINKKVLLFVGMLTPLKGIDLLLDVYSKLVTGFDNLLLLIIGGLGNFTSYNALILSKIKLLSPDKVKLLGYVPYDKIAEYYKLADILIAPSYTEGCAMNLLEATCCGLTVISTNVGCASDVILDRKLLCVPGDYYTLADCMLYALAVSNFKNKKTVSAYTRSRYSPSTIGRKLKRYYESL